MGLACIDHVHRDSTVMLLHGLAGCAEEWLGTAAALGASHRVLIPDQRGHGRSERRPADMTRDAYVGDAALWLEQLTAAPAVVVGQSLGGHTAFLLAARRPELVRALVVVEATPEPDPAGRDQVMRWLATWPVPFASMGAALDFFGGDSAWARGWVRTLEARNDELWPRFDIDAMQESLAEASTHSYWEEWCRVSCPTLIVRGENGLDRALVRRMQDCVAMAQVVEIPGAGHDLHLEQPDLWQRCLTSFLAGL